MTDRDILLTVYSRCRKILKKWGPILLEDKSNKEASGKVQVASKIGALIQEHLDGIDFKDKGYDPEEIPVHWQQGR